MKNIKRNARKENREKQIGTFLILKSEIKNEREWVLRNASGLVATLGQMKFS